MRQPRTRSTFCPPLPRAWPLGQVPPIWLLSCPRHLLRLLPRCAAPRADWYGYEGLKRSARQAGFGGDRASGTSGSAEELDPSVSFLCGATSGAFAAFCTTPFDVLKTRRQVARMAADSGGRGGENLSTLRLLEHVARTEGVGALFAGWVPRLVKVAPSCAVMIASYELGKAFFRRRSAAVSRDPSLL